MVLDIEKVKAFSNKAWDDEIIPNLSKYVEIPNQSPVYDKDWATNGYTEQAINLIHDWIKRQNVAGLKSEIKTIPGLTPIIFITVDATKPDAKTVLLYGHMDKQPPLTDQWDADLHPYKPVIKNGKLYGRGSSDDGYASFASIAAIQALKEQNIPHDRYVIIIEGSEESGSIHLPAYIEQLSDEIQTPSVVVCLDSGCGNYDQLWITTSLRGLVAGDLKIRVLQEAVHSGSASGIVPDSFRILRQVIDKLENGLTGEVNKRLHVEIPEERLKQIKVCAEVLGDTIYTEFLWDGKTEPVTKDLNELMINKTWRPQLTVTGADGLPPTSNAGNVLRVETKVKLSIRLPPTLDSNVATAIIKELLETNPPYGATVSFTADKNASGFNAPATAPWLSKALTEASNTFYGKQEVHLGEGGSIPFMGMLLKRYPNSQFIITGVLGPASNAHGPNEFLHIDFGKKLTSCIVYILNAHASQ